MLSIDYTASLIDQKALRTIMDMLLPEIERLACIHKQPEKSPYSFVNLPFDNCITDSIEPLIIRKKSLGIKLVLLIGIGGSNLGTLGIFQALFGNFFNDLNPACKFYSLDTLDERIVCDLTTIIKGYLESRKNIYIVLITKSGTTVETLANGSYFIELLKKYKPTTWQEYIIYITDKYSPLYQHGVCESIEILEVPKEIGGRYSIFSNVGLFPLRMLDVNIEQLLEGARAITQECLTSGYENIAAITASLMYAHYTVGRPIHDIFLSSPNYAYLGAWYRQLLAESIGKSGIGITPTVSIATADLHSVLQLYFGGPHNRFSTFIDIEEPNCSINIPSVIGEVSYGAGYGFQQVSQAIFKGVRQAFVLRERPYNFIKLKNNPYYLGQFLQYKMIEVVYLGFLLKVNSFDQPEIELYKQQTRRILGYE
ncbi:MAG TPA: hypothetical protein VHA52_01620 [Candidatus Babeliaceae bacterium]|nr:hypothetical protein [Candidatus Babeliaceae bacterium]